MANLFEPIFKKLVKNPQFLQNFISQQVKRSAFEIKPLAHTSAVLTEIYQIFENNKTLLIISY
jgi:hypothetical protein